VRLAQRGWREGRQCATHLDKGKVAADEETDRAEEIRIGDTPHGSVADGVAHPAQRTLRKQNRPDEEAHRRPIRHGTWAEATELDTPRRLEQLAAGGAHDIRLGAATVWPALVPHFEAVAEDLHCARYEAVHEPRVAKSHEQRRCSVNRGLALNLRLASQMRTPETAWLCELGRRANVGVQQSAAVFRATRRRDCAIARKLLCERAVQVANDFRRSRPCRRGAPLPVRRKVHIFLLVWLLHRRPASWAGEPSLPRGIQ
jgi:hypothetical protein